MIPMRISSDTAHTAVRTTGNTCHRDLPPDPLLAASNCRCSGLPLLMMIARTQEFTLTGQEYSCMSHELVHQDHPRRRYVARQRHVILGMPANATMLG